MAKSILQKLYDGEIYPSENISVDTPEYHKIRKALANEKERFLKSLSDNNRENFKKIEDLYDELADTYSYAGFAHGFRLAVALIFESQNINGISE
jgi:hypothetical protein